MYVRTASFAGMPLLAFAGLNNTWYALAAVTLYGAGVADGSLIPKKQS